MSIATGIKGTLSLGKGLGKTIDDAYKKYVKGGGKKTKKVFGAEELSKKKQLEKAKQNRQIKQQKSKTKSTDLVPTGQSKTIKETVNPKKIKQNFKTIGKPVDKTPKINKPKKQGTSLVTVPSATSKNILNKQKQSFLKRNKGKIAGGAGVLSTVPFLINTDDSKIGAKENKKITPSKDIKVDTSKITKPITAKVKKQTLPQTKADDYTGKFIDKEGNVAYDSFSDFLAHMTGKPKKRAMPKKTARIIGTGNKLKRKEADTKGAGKGVKFQAFKAGTKDKTVGKPKSLKNVMNKKIKDAEKKDSTFGMLKTAVNYPQLFERVTKKSGGGLIAGLYDKPEKAETYKGNTSSARQVKGYGKARKR